MVTSTVNNVALATTGTTTDANAKSIGTAPTVILLGLTGTGKTSLANKIIGPVPTSDGKCAVPFPVKAKLGMRTYEFLSVMSHQGPPIQCIDGPGFSYIDGGNTYNPIEFFRQNSETAKGMMAAIDECCGVNLVLFSYRLDTNCGSDQKKALSTIYGKIQRASIAKYAAIVFTVKVSNSTEFEEPFEQLLRECLEHPEKAAQFACSGDNPNGEEVSKLLSVCGHRFCVVNIHGSADTLVERRKVETLVLTLQQGACSRYTTGDMKNDFPVPKTVLRILAVPIADASSSSSSSSSSSDSGCFPALASVLAFHGSGALIDLPISKVTTLATPLVGIRPTSAETAFQASRDYVAVWGHRDDTETLFIEMTTDSGHTLRITPNHLLPVQCTATGAFVLKPAGEVLVGEAVSVVSRPLTPDEPMFSVAKITGLRTVMDVGRYAPLAAGSPCIVVNGVVVSCYTNDFNPAVSHAFVRLIACFPPSLSQWMLSLAANTIAGQRNHSKQIKEEPSTALQA